MLEASAVTHKSNYEKYADKMSGESSGRVVLKKGTNTKFLQKLVFKSTCRVSSCNITSEDSDIEIIDPKDHENHNTDRLDAFREFLVGPLFRRSLGERAPNITLVQNDKKDSNKLYIHSKYLENNFQTLREFFNKQKLKNGAILSNHIKNIEEVLAACLLWADNDWHADNIGVIQQYGQDVAAKIDHGNALISFHANANAALRSIVSFAQKYTIADKQYRWQIDWHKLSTSLKRMMNEAPLTEVYSILSDRLMMLRKAGFKIKGESFVFELDTYDQWLTTNETHVIAEKGSYKSFASIIKSKLISHFAMLENLVHLLEKDISWLQNIGKQQDPLRHAVDLEKTINNEMAIILACQYNCTFDTRSSTLTHNHKGHGFNLLNFGFMHCYTEEVKTNESEEIIMSARRYLVKHSADLLSGSSCISDAHDYYKIASILLEEYAAHVKKQTEQHYSHSLNNLSIRLIHIAGNNEIKAIKIPSKSIALLLEQIIWQNEQDQEALQYKAHLFSRCSSKSIYKTFIANSDDQYLDQVAAACNYANRCKDNEQAGWQEKHKHALKEVASFAALLNKTRYKTAAFSAATSVASSINGDLETPYLSEDEDFTEAGNKLPAKSHKRFLSNQNSHHLGL